MNVELIKLVQTCLQKNLNFVVFSLPKQLEFTVFVEDHSNKITNEKAFVFHPFLKSDNTPEVQILANLEFHSSRISKADIAIINTLKSLPKRSSSEHDDSISEQEYLKNLSQGIEHIKNTELEKFIFSRIKTITKSDDLDLSNYLISLNKSYPNTFTYLFNHQKTGLWLGATPETLLHWNQGKIKTMALAGTLPDNGKKPEWSQKEIEEQQYVTQYISKAFSANNIEHQISETETVSAGPVFHLISQINSASKVSFSKALQFVDALHPTPAICGIPLQKALQTISRFENHDRTYYTGYLGIVEPEKSLRLFVNLRCMQVFSNSLALHVGGGITALSNPQKEWDETNFKAKTLIDLLPKNKQKTVN